MFSPQTVPKPGTSLRDDAKQRVEDVARGGLAPWEDGHLPPGPPLKPGKTWQFTIYGGLYNLSAVRDTLVEACLTAEEDSVTAGHRPKPTSGTRQVVRGSAIAQSRYPCRKTCTPEVTMSAISASDGTVAPEEG
jgi:hypothetical protein